ncbi:EndoU domain-containing protein [Apibacter raozihei]|uniref:EndoU domain-containing protein n=1 Tax=Apibacter raozihei TaxID=2500547 RepID=UPI000FE2FCCD|nr:EndoU domain-containing protein [Apibacter raozihei]
MDGHGPNRGKQQGAFPDTWTDDQAIAAIEKVANSPKSRWEQTTGPGVGTFTTGGPNPNAQGETNTGRPVSYKVTGQDHGKNIEVIVRPSGEGIITGYVKS